MIALFIPVFGTGQTNNAHPHPDQLDHVGVIEKDSRTGQYRVRPVTKPGEVRPLNKSKVDFQRFDTELHLQKRFEAQQEEIQRTQHAKAQAANERRLHATLAASQLKKITLLRKETEFYECPPLSRIARAPNGTNAAITNVLINGKQADTIVVEDSFTLTFSFAPNTISAVVNIYVDRNSNGVADDGDPAIVSNGLVFDNGEYDLDAEAGEFEMKFAERNYYSNFISTLIFEVNDYQTASSALLKVRDTVTSKVVIGKIFPVFKNTVISLYSNFDDWFRNVFPDSTGEFIVHFDSTLSKSLVVYYESVGYSPAEFISPKDSVLLLKKDTIRFTAAYRKASEFIEGYVKDQFSNPVKNAVVTVFPFGSPIRSATTDSTGYYKLGTTQGNFTVFISSPTGLNEYMRYNISSYGYVDLDQTLEMNFVLYKTVAVISGTVKYESIGVGGVPVFASNDSLNNITLTGIDGYYAVKVWKGAIGNQYYNVSTGVNDYGYYIENAYLQNVPAGSANINFTMKKVTGGLQGRVMDINSGSPVKDAYINFGGPAFRYTQSDDSGFYKVRLPEGTYSIFINAQHYEYYNEMNVAVTASFAVKNIFLARTGSFSGTVRDESGTPIPNAFITGHDTVGFNFGWGYSESDGSFVISNLQTSVYKARASAEGFISQWYEGKSTADSATAFSVIKGFDTPNINFVLSRGGSISGVVKDKYGFGISNVYVVVRDTFYSSVSSAVTNDSGTYIVTGLQTGAYFVSASGDGYVRQWYDNEASHTKAKKVFAVIHQNTPDINFTLVKGGRISGFVKDKMGNPIPRAEVVAVDTTMYLLQYDYTNDSGRYEITGLVPGTKYFVTAWMEGFARRWYDNAPSFETATPLVVGDEEEKQNINITLPLSGKISGVVKNNAGLPIQYANVSAQSLSGFEYRYGSTDQSGNYRIDNLNGGTYIVSASHFEYTEQWYDHKSAKEFADSVVVEEEQTVSNINFNLSSGGKISGTVKNVSGQPVQFANIYASQTDGFHSYYGYSDEMGNYMLNNVTPGRYIVAANYNDYLPQWYDHKSVIHLADTIVVEAEKTTPNIIFDLKPVPPPSFDSIIVRLSCVSIPDTFVFSKTGLPDYYVDYWWGIRMDVDNNASTGPFGCEIELAVFHYKFPGEQEHKSTLINGTYHVSLVWDGETSSWLHNDVVAALDPSDNNSIVLKAPKSWLELNPVSSTTKYYIHTYSRLDDKEGNDITPVSSGFIAVTDPTGDAGFAYIDIVKATPDIVTVVDDPVHKALPLTYSLAQNYPNPFNPSTTIQYSLPHRSNVRLVIYNLLGQQVHTLVNEEQSAGWKEIRWNAAPLASGVYFYTLNAGNFAETKKMVLMK